MKVRARMGLREDWTDRRRLLRFLAGELERGRLTLVLGSGVSFPFGLPEWVELVVRLFEQVGLDVPATDPAQAAEVFRIEHCESDESRFLAAVDEALYRDADLSPDRLSARSTLSALGAIMMALSRRASVAQAVTFNFDDVLEQYLDLNGLSVRSVGEAAHWAGDSEALVFHPHGLLPQLPFSERSSRLIFDQRSYSKEIGNDSQPWRQQLVTLMRTNTCLFVGVGSRDGAMDSLLVKVSELHAANGFGQLFWGVRTVVGAPESERLIWNDRNVFLADVGDFDQGLPQFLFSICRIAAEARRARFAREGRRRSRRTSL